MNVLQHCSEGQLQAYAGYEQLCLQGSEGRLSIGALLLTSSEEHSDVQLIRTCEETDHIGQQAYFDCNHLK